MQLSQNSGGATVSFTAKVFPRATTNPICWENSTTCFSKPARAISHRRLCAPRSSSCFIATNRFSAFPFALLNALIEIDEQVANFRYRHLQMVRRMIGTRVGTGGSSGEQYLQGAVNKNYIYKELAGVITFLIERRSLPDLPARVCGRRCVSVPRRADFIAE